MKKQNRLVSLGLFLSLLFSLLCVMAGAKTNSTGQTVDTVLFYVKNSAGEDILLSHMSIAEMEADLEAGQINTVNHNYAVLDRYVTTIHQEAQGFTVAELLDYAQRKSVLPALRTLELSFTGEDKIAFWEIDQSGFDEMDTYTWDTLYGTARYNFPLLYEYWNYRTQDYYDPNGSMSRDQVIDHILANSEPEQFLLSVRAFSQRYMLTDGKYGTGDYNMENLWLNRGVMDTTRALRMMLPMTENDLRGAISTASNTRYWISNLRLDMTKAPTVAALGKVSEPTATMSEDEHNYYISFSCATPGAVILYNHNYSSPSYTPTCAYTGGEVVVPKSVFPNGVVTMTCRAVKDGYTDAGVTTLQLTASGAYTKWSNPYSDVTSDSWFYNNVAYVTQRGLFDAVSADHFAPDAPMTRAMLAQALYRMAGSPHADAAPFTDVAANTAYAKAVDWCYASGVVKGVSDISFDPDASITREQIVTMFHRYAQNVAKADMSVSSSLTAYTDADKLADWADAQMQWAVAAGLINGVTTTTLVPQGTATRAQTAAMVQRLENYL